MSWFRLDDKGVFHQKVVRAGNHAYGAWCRAGQWSSGESTDGVVPLEIQKLIEPSAAIWKKLILVGLAEPIEGSTDIRIHDFLDYNPSAIEAAAKKKARSDAGRRGGIQSGNARANAPQSESKPGPTDKAKIEAIASAFASPTGEAKTNPVPSRPDPDPDQILSETSRLPLPLGRAPGAAAASAGFESEAGKAIRLAMEGSKPLAFVATVELAAQLAQHCAETGTGGKWRLSQVLESVAECGAKLAAEQAGGVHKGPSQVIGMLVGFVKAGPKPTRSNARVSKQPPSSAWRPKAIDDPDDPLPAARPGDPNAF